MYLFDSNVLNIMTAMNFMTITNWLALDIRFCVLYARVLSHYYSSKRNRNKYCEKMRAYINNLCY